MVCTSTEASCKAVCADCGPSQPWRHTPALHSFLGPLGQKIYRYIRMGKWGTVERIMHVDLGVKESCPAEKEAFMKTVRGTFG